MRLKKVQIINFRKLANVSMTLDHDLTVIVGPNATGKTSIFEAIRLCKSLLMPRTQDEPQQVLVALGASTPHIMFGQFQYDFSSIAGDTTLAVEIKLHISVSHEEISKLKSESGRVSQSIIAGSLGQQNQHSSFNLIQYLSSPEGENHLARVNSSVNARLEEIEKSGEIELWLTINPQQIHGHNQIDQVLASTLEGLVEPSKAIFSYFPADRSLPVGEVNVQLHSGDMKAHVDSHFASAANKYPRLKQVIVNRLITSGADKLGKEFSLIFENLLPGKRFKGLQQKAVGTISVQIEDIESGHIFDIDSMSSGEKGLVLTYLLLRTSLEKNGIVLVDEPELHLNPSVCRKLLGFLNKHICKHLDAQVLLCTHSPDMLTQAFEDDEFGLFELLNSRSLNPLYREDKDEMYEALKRLGVAPSDSLVSRGFVFVEGEDDIALYEKGFPELLRGFKIIQKRGRKEVEKEIEVLQKAENQGKLDKIHLFIFDNDRKPVSLRSSRLVKVVQLKRYCIENYLLNDRILYNFLKEVAVEKPSSRVNLSSDIKELSLMQLKQVVATEAYGDLQELSCGMRVKSLRDKDLSDIAAILKLQLETVSTALDSLDLSSWEQLFIDKCNKIEARLCKKWDAEHIILANGKLVFESIQRKYQMHLPLIKIKTEMMGKIAAERTSEWQELNQVFAANLT